ncbi:MAG: hypothetical protein K0S20_402 [Patescibacteria group bacterium]|nr:hypothetical protein [Patescibacteria group bacterium]
MARSEFDTYNSFDTDTSSGSASTVSTVVALLLIAGLIAAAYFLLLKRKKERKLRLFDSVGIKVVLPKQLQEAQEDRRDPKDVLGVMEAVYTSIHHFYESGLKQRVWEGQPTFSFEVVAHSGEIFFYVVAPKEAIPQVERQIHSQYPHAHIEPAHDYDIFLEKGGASAVASVGLLKQGIFPIRTYKNLENDPLNALTNSLSKVGEGKAAIQILIQPINQNWQHKIEESLQNIQQGKSFHANSSVAQKAFSVAREVGQTALANQSDAHNSNEAQNTAAGNVRLTAMQEQQAKLLVEKGSKVGFNVQIRCVARMNSEIEAKNQVQTMLSSFSQFQAPESNGFKIANKDDRKQLVDYILRSFSNRQPTLILNSEELASIFHFPNRPLDTPNVHWLGARKLAPPTNMPKSGLLLGYSSFRGTEIPIHMSYEDRLRHFYMIGKSGSGKTTIFQNMILQDIRNGHGVCYMDPNGDAVDWIVKHIPKERAEDVIIFDPSDTARPMALNLLEYDPAFPEQKTMVINEVLSIFDKLYDLKATGGPIFEQYMRNAMLLVMDDPESGSTLMEIPKVLADAEFRKYKLSKSRNQVVIDFWVNEAEKAGGEAALANMVPYITSKLTQFTSNDIMRPLIGQQKSAFNFREIMDSKKILLVTLPKGLLGDMNAQLLGMIISGKIQIAAFSRQSQPEAQRVPFYLYVDEFQNFTSKTFATILAEARKYRLSLNITNQYLDQLDEETRDAVFGNVGTMLTWIIGAKDAEVFEKEFDPLTVDDFVNTEKRNFYIRLLIDGATSKPFNAASYPPDPHENSQIGDAIKQLSRLKYGRDRELVESEIRLRAKMR